MNDLAVNTLASNITTSITTDYTQSIIDRCCTGIYNPGVVPYYDSYNNTITVSAYPVKLETDSNELKINIKKHLIKFNFSL